MNGDTVRKNASPNSEVHILEDLIRVSRDLGRPDRHLAMIGEGNTSGRSDAESFYVKASGTNLTTIDADGFVLLSFRTILTLMEADRPTAADIGKVFDEAKIDRKQHRRPSVETLLHAVCLSYPGVDFVAHTHPTAVNALACSQSYPDCLRGRMYPDEIVLLGRDSVFVPYIDPGVELAKTIKREIDAYIDRNGEMPKSMYLQNHGFVALGGSAREVENITLTADKAAAIRLGALQAGGISLLPEETVAHIAGRPDEKYRRQLFGFR